MQLVLVIWSSVAVRCSSTWQNAIFVPRSAATEWITYSPRGLLFELTKCEAIISQWFRASPAFELRNLSKLFQKSSEHQSSAWGESAPMLRMKKDVPTGAYSWASHVVSQTLAVLYIVVIPLVCSDVALSINRSANCELGFSLCSLKLS